MSYVRSYFESCDYQVVGMPSGVFPSDGKKYFMDLKTCPYCSSSLTKKELPDYWTHRAKSIKSSGLGSTLIFELVLATCTNTLCGWWALEDYEFDWEFRREEAVIKWGQIKNFEISCREVPIGLLRNELHRNPKLVYLTHHDAFERLMADCLRDKFPGSYVKHVGRSGDGGVDIFCIIDDEPCLVQIKRRMNGSIVEGPSVVRELNGVLLREGVYHGMLISTAERFSKAAFAEKVIRMETKKPVKVELISYDGIIEMVRKRVSVYEPWAEFITPRT